LKRYSPNPGRFERGVVACTGSEFCRFGIVETKVRAVEWAREMDGGSATGAGGGQDALLRLLGLLRAAPDRGRRLPRRDREDQNAIVEGVDIGLGGSLGKDAAFIDWVEGAKPAEEVPDALVAVFERFREERREGERFHEWARARGTRSCGKPCASPRKSGVVS
jgi:ferredoxin-nitrite reductase